MQSADCRLTLIAPNSSFRSRNRVGSLDILSWSEGFSRSKTSFSFTILIIVKQNKIRRFFSNYFFFRRVISNLNYNTYVFSHKIIYTHWLRTPSQLNSHGFKQKLTWHNLAEILNKTPKECVPFANLAIPKQHYSGTMSKIHQVKTIPLSLNRAHRRHYPFPGLSRQSLLTHISITKRFCWTRDDRQEIKCNENADENSILCKLFVGIASLGHNY